MKSHKAVEKEHCVQQEHFFDMEAVEEAAESLLFCPSSCLLIFSRNYSIWELVVVVVAMLGQICFSQQVSQRHLRFLLDFFFDLN